jgi:hypothetical protein
MLPWTHIQPWTYTGLEKFLVLTLLGMLFTDFFRYLSKTDLKGSLSKIKRNTKHGEVTPYTIPLIYFVIFTVQGGLWCIFATTPPLWNVNLIWAAETLTTGGFLIPFIKVALEIYRGRQLIRRAPTR